MTNDVRLLAAVEQCRAATSVARLHSAAWPDCPWLCLEESVQPSSRRRAADGGRRALGSASSRTFATYRGSRGRIDAPFAAHLTTIAMVTPPGVGRRVLPKTHRHRLPDRRQFYHSVRRRPPAWRCPSSAPPVPNRKVCRGPARSVGMWRLFEVGRRHLLTQYRPVFPTSS